MERVHFLQTDGDNIRYGLTAIKSLGRPVIEAIIRERNAEWTISEISEDFVERLSGKEINKRTVENLIKAGALDCFDGNTKTADDRLCAV